MPAGNWLSNLHLHLQSSAKAHDNRRNIIWFRLLVPEQNCELYCLIPGFYLWRIQPISVAGFMWYPLFHTDVWQLNVCVSHISSWWYVAAWGYCRAYWMDVVMVPYVDMYILLFCMCYVKVMPCMAELWPWIDGCTAHTSRVRVIPLQRLLAVGCYRGSSWVKSIFCPWYVPLPLHCLLCFKMFPGGCWWCLQMGSFYITEMRNENVLIAKRWDVCWQFWAATSAWKTAEQKHQIRRFHRLQCYCAPCWTCILSLHHIWGDTFLNTKSFVLCASIFMYLKPLCV